MITSIENGNIVSKIYHNDIYTSIHVVKDVCKSDIVYSVAHLTITEFVSVLLENGNCNITISEL